MQIPENFKWTATQDYQRLKGNGTGTLAQLICDSGQGVAAAGRQRRF